MLSPTPHQKGKHLIQMSLLESYFKMYLGTLGQYSLISASLDLLPRSSIIPYRLH